MDDRALRLALESLLDEPTLRSAHRASIERGLADLRAQRLSPDERAYLCVLIEHYAAPAPSADPVDALIAVFQHKLPAVDPVALSTAIHALVAGDTAQLDGRPIALTIERRGQIQIANLAERNVVMGDLNQLDISVHIPIPDARFDALLASALKTYEQEKTLARIQHAAQQTESDRLLNLRLKGFVGRVTELAAIREQIAAMRPTGGYVLIKAAAGEGKSSSIAKLIQEAGIATTPHHFIDLTPDPKYQLGLLRTVVAQLILKHGLTVSYFPQDSYHAMKAEFARILNELSKQGIQETIYLDGLDQLKPEDDGLIDLSFLPPQPPPCIVIVIGSRPDETLKPFNIVHRVDYDLPPLNEADALALWRSVQPAVADSLLHDLYAALKGNALFVHLAADTMHDQSVVDATSLIRQIEQNPQNLFGITLDRIKRVPRSKWDTVWKPMLALLIVAQEPLRLDVLGDLLGHDHETMQDAVRILGGLVSQGIDQRVALHHLMFRDYLTAIVFAAREVKRWHQRLANWCSIDLDAIWTDDRAPIEQTRRMYARYHYITHLALAENWTTLWQVLDAGNYGEYKTRFDPSTRLYALDLDRGRESTMHAGQSIEEHIQHLPRLWKYSLLRTSLSSSINQWPPKLFEILAQLGRIQEAMERIELCTNPDTQLDFWQCILPWCNKQQQMSVITRMQQVLPSASSFAQVRSLMTIAEQAVTMNIHQDSATLIQQAISIVPSITGGYNYVRALIAIIRAGIAINDHPQIVSLISQVMTIISAMEDTYLQHEAWIVLSKAFILIGDSDSANALIEKAILCVLSAKVEHNVDMRDTAFPSIVRAFIDNDNISRAQTIAYDIPSDIPRVKATLEIADAIVITDFNLAQQLIHEAEIIAYTGYGWQQAEILAAIVQTATTMGYIGYATRLFDQVYAKVIDSSSGYSDIDVLISLTLTADKMRKMDRVSHLLQLAIEEAYSSNKGWYHTHYQSTIAQIALSLGYHEQASTLIRQAMANIQQQDDNRYRVDALPFMMHIIANAQDSDEIKGIIDKAMAIIQTIETEKLKIAALEMLATASAQAGFFNSALAIAATIDNPNRYERIVAIVAHTQADEGLLAQALMLTKSIIHQDYRLDALRKIAKIAAKQGMLQSMTEHALSQESSKTRTEFLYAIIDAAATRGDIDYALDLTKLMQQDNQHHAAITTIVRRILLSGNLEYATSIALSIRPAIRQTSALIAITTAAIKMGDLNHAITIVQDIPDVWHRTVMLLEIAQSANKNGKHLLVETCLDRAKNSVYLLPTGQRQDAIWSALVSQYCVLNDLETATLIAKTIVNQEIRASSFMVLAQIYHAREESSSMIHMLNEAMQSVCEIPNPQQSIDILLQLVSIQKVMRICHDKRSILAEIFKRTTRIENQEHRIDALIKIAIQIKIAAIETDHSAILHDALRLAQSIDMTEHQIESLIKIAIAMATIGNFEQSIAIVQSLEEESQPNAILRIAIALTKIGDIDQALIFTQFILDDFIRVNTWTRMVAVMTENKNHQKAREVLHSTIEQISLMNTTDDVLSRLANSAALLGQLDQAFAIAQSISNTAQRSEILATLIQTYDPTPERTLSIIQSVWYQVKHDSRLWDFLPLATPLLDQYPWLGIAILETEKWVKQQQVWLV